MIFVMDRSGTRGWGGEWAAVGTRHWADAVGEQALMAHCLQSTGMAQWMVWKRQQHLARRSF